MEVSFQKPIDVDATVTSAVPTVQPAPVETPAPAVAVAPAPAPAPAPVAVAPTPVVDTTPAPAIPTAAATPPLAVVAAPTPGAVTTSGPVEFDDDNIGFEDVILPRINIVQKVGDLSNIFTEGEIVLNQSLIIHEPARTKGTTAVAGNPPLSLTILGFRRRQFTEKVAGGKLGLLLNSEAEVAKIGGTLDYKEWKQSEDAAKVPGNPPAKKYFQRLATAAILLEKPAHVVDDDHVSFPYDCEGRWYALVLWSMKGTSYTKAAKVFFTARKIGHLRAGYLSQSWNLTTKLEGFGENFAWVPAISPGPKTSEEFKTFAKMIMGAGN